MIKDPNAPYMPGIRGKKMLKFKAEPETLDLVIVGGIYGRGRRANLIGSYLVAAQDENWNLKTIAHTATGLDDDTLLELSNKVEALIIEKKGRKVKAQPEIILEVAFSEIVKSPEYEGGYSLRFPVVKRIRNDLSIDDIDTVERVESMYQTMKIISEWSILFEFIFVILLNSYNSKLNLEILRFLTFFNNLSQYYKILY